MRSEIASRRSAGISVKIIAFCCNRFITFANRFFRRSKKKTKEEKERGRERKRIGRSCATWISRWLKIYRFFMRETTAETDKSVDSRKVCSINKISYYSVGSSTKSVSIIYEKNNARTIRICAFYPITNLLYVQNYIQ